jgi:hypothetical protein
MTVLFFLTIKNTLNNYELDFWRVATMPALPPVGAMAYFSGSDESTPGTRFDDLDFTEIEEICWLDYRPDIFQLRLKKLKTKKDISLVEMNRLMLLDEWFDDEDLAVHTYRQTHEKTPPDSSGGA